jgi:phage terminase large subunit-like protein
VVLTSVDLQGFGDLEGMTLTEVNRLDETAITTTAVCPNNNWYVLDITYGRWGVKETANKIAEVVGYYKPSLLGVEKGALRNAIAPFLDSSLREKDIFMEVQGLSHGGTAKVDRVFWALQGRYERGMIHYPVGSYPWKEYLNKQLMSFPSRSVHNDLPDSLAYIDQLSKSRIPQEVYDSWDYSDQEDFEPLDNITGY